jgi:hypothetical protein
MICGSHSDTLIKTKPQLTDNGGPNASAYEPHCAGRRPRDRDPPSRYPSPEGGWLPMSHDMTIIRLIPT